MGPAQGPGCPGGPLPPRDRRGGGGETCLVGASFSYHMSSEAGAAAQAAERMLGGWSEASRW